MSASQHTNNESIRQVVIVGGGTAGWLAANHLANNLATNTPEGVNVTLIESPNIPTVGVGEGTVPMMRQSLQTLGISETDFIRECDATFKQGIKFVDWLHNPVAGKPEYYHHIFDYPHIHDVDLTPYWLKAHRAQTQGSGSAAGISENLRTSYVDYVALQGKICDAGLAPKQITTPEYQGNTAYAYHLDAGKFSGLLTRNATERLGVKHVLAEVVNVLQADNGDIIAVETDTAGTIAGDLFIDCTGFSALLIGDKLNVPFIDKSDVLFADHAVVMQVPYQNPQADIVSHTVSTAQPAGWIWDIGLQTRRGVGHVYSSNHTSHEQAEQALRNYVEATSALGNRADNVGTINIQDINTRVIKMKVGYREKFWQNNCVALGLSQGFVEPLEATGLLVFDVTAKMLAEQFPTCRAEMPLIANLFNQRMRESWDKVIDFIKLHYCISKRDDSDFWLDNRASKSIPDSLQERLERWRYQPPTKYDFFSGVEIFNLENYLYVLYGMHYPTASGLLNTKTNQVARAEAYRQWLEQQSEQALKHLPSNRELINKIKQYGFKKL